MDVFPPAQATARPIIGPAQVAQMRKSQADQDVANQVYMSDPQFKQLVDHLAPFMKQQGTEDRLPTFALNNYYKIDTSTKTDKGTAAMLQNIAKPPAEQAPWTQRHPILAGIGRGIMDTIQAPGDLVAGVADKALSLAPGLGYLGQTPEAQSISKNAGNTAKIATTTAAAALTGGASLPAQMGLMAAGAGGGELLNQGIHDIAGDNPNTLGQQAMSVAGNAAMGAALPVAGKVLSPITDPIGNALGNVAGKAIDAVGLRPAADFLKQGVMPLPEGGVFGPPAAPEATTLTPEQQKAWEAIRPKNTTANMKEAVANGTYARGARDAGFFKSSGGAAPSKLDLPAIDAAANDVPGLMEAKTLPDKLDAVGNALQATGQMRDNLLKTNNVVYPNAESNAAVSEAAQQSGALYGQDGKDIATEMTKRWAELRAENSGNLTGEYDTLKQFEKVMSKGSEAIYSKDTAQGNVFRAIRRASQDVVSRQLEANDLGQYKPLIDKMANMYDIRDNLASHVSPNDFLSTAGKLLKNKWVKAGLMFGGYETLKHETPLGHVLP